MAFRHILRSFNIAIAAVLAAGLFAVYWFAWRPLPQISGTITAPVARRAVIARDSLGVPHITAESIDDALFAQGFTTAQDRLWQMDTLRRLSAGRLSEVFGPATLELDREARRLRMERIAEAQYRALPANERAPFAAYARGVNHFIETHRNRLPLEFSLLRYDPAPWRVVDSILVGLFMYRSLTSTWREEVLKSNLLVGGDPAKVDFLFAARTGPQAVRGSGAGPVGGSNAWAVAGSRTAAGRPLLSSDPHLEYSIPGIWYMAHLKAPGLNATGVSFPGLPGVILGHNDHIAWGATNLQFDVQDLYIENLDPRTGRYIYVGQPATAVFEREYIAVKGGRPVEFSQWVTRHGPVIASDRNRFLALRWIAAEASGFSFPFLALDRAKNWQEFTAALASYGGPAQNFVYADQSNIGYHAAGKLPIRRTFDGDVPVDGSSGKYEWDGFIPFEQLPQSFNPASGLIVSANQNPFPANYPYRVSGNFDAPDRSHQIEALLAARKNWRAGEMLAVQKDVYSALCHLVAREIVAAHDRKGAAGPPVAEALRILRNWNGQMEYDSAAPLIARLAFDHLRAAIGEKASPGNGAIYDSLMAPAVVQALLRSRPKEWFADYDGLLVRTFGEALEEGRRMQGRDPARWKYGGYTRLLLAHPVGHRLPLVSKYFDIGPAPQSGAPTTAKQFATIKLTGGKLGPSMRMTVDFSNLDGSYQNIVAGQSGHVLSPHYKDQWEAYYYGRSFPMQFLRVEAKDTLVIEPER